APLLFTNKMEGNSAGMRGATVFPKINALPCAEGEFTSADGNRKIYGRERGADMGGHVIVTFGSMNKNGIAIRHEPRKETFQVTANIGIGIFLNEQGCGSVAKMQCQEAIFKTVLREPGSDFVSELVKATATGGNFQLVLGLAHKKSEGRRSKVESRTNSSIRWACGPRSFFRDQDCAGSRRRELFDNAIGPTRP